MRLPALEASTAARLGLPVILARADSAIGVPLSTSEHLCLSALKQARRKRDWLLGRDALKQVLSALSRDEDTSRITFPNCRVSLTHSGGVSLAVGTTTPAAGIGIDYEPLRNVNSEFARFFLNETEIEWVKQQPESVETRELLRLWTIKEAAFKCYPLNAGMLLADFTVLNTATAAAEVAVKGEEDKIVVACCAYDSGWLSVAVFRNPRALRQNPAAGTHC